jgi:DNA-binding IclR family transcriptional regulator
MTRGSPGVERAAAVLALLSAAPQQSFTLAEIVRQTDLSKATCHALLSSLVDVRWLLRHPAGPSYRLGPRLIALGESARRGYPELPYAQDQMRELGAELGLECLASAVVDGEIVILAKSGVPAPLSVSAYIGQRVPIAPPLATVFLAWSDEAAIAEAFGTSSHAEPITDTYRRALTAVRDRGFSVGLENPTRERLGRAFASQRATGRAAKPDVADLVTAMAAEDYQLIDATHNSRYWLNHLAAPVFDATGRVSLALTLVGFPSALDAGEIQRHGRRLRAAADAVTVAVHGSTPAVARYQEVAP